MALINYHNSQIEPADKVKICPVRKKGISQMKRFLVAAMTMAMMVSSAGALNLYFDSEPMVTDVPAQIIDGRTMLPIGHIFDAFGARVTWDDSTKTATGEKVDTKIVIQINNNTAYVNGDPVALDVPAMIVDNRTMVPAWFVSTALGAKVYWDGATTTVRIAAKVYDVLRVVDGDTIVVDYNGVEEHVRLIGIDTPESVHPDSSKNTEAGMLASGYTKARLDGKEVELEFDTQQRDQYGRLLAYVWVDGVMYNKTILSDGVANLATYPPNIKHVDEFTAIVEQRTKPSQGGQTTTEVKKTGTFVGSLESDKYHNPSCRHAKKITVENEIWFDTAKEAATAGYLACGVCNPK